MAFKTWKGLGRRRTGGGGSRTIDVPSPETPEIEVTQALVPDAVTPLTCSMVTMSVEELQNLLPTTMASQVTNVVDAVLANRLGQGYQSQCMSEESLYLRDFQEYDPPIFEGQTPNTEEVESWLEAVELAFRHMNCPDSHKIYCATYMLRNRAHSWWESTLRTIVNNDGPITWEQFREAFFREYYPRTVRFQRQEEFVQLKQGNMTVEEYEHEFDRLSRFAPKLVSTDEDKAERFVNGLNWDIMRHLLAHEELDYAKAVRVATIIDNANRRNARGPRIQQGSRNKRKFDKNPSMSQQQTLQRKVNHHRAPQRQLNRQPPLVVRKPMCRQCGRDHDGECLAGSGACFRCGKGGHRMAECPYDKRGDANRLSGSNQGNRGSQAQARGVGPRHHDL